MEQHRKRREIAKELYKSHYTVKEASTILGTSYPQTAILYKQFKDSLVIKYDRINLISDTYKPIVMALAS